MASSQSNVPLTLVQCIWLVLAQDYAHYPFSHMASSSTSSVHLIPTYSEITEQTKFKTNIF
jgi:hypothetical protein